jgi:hypothetical protein
LRTHLLFFTLAILSIGKSFAQVESFQTGEVLNHTLSICIHKESAVAVIEADAKGGLDAAAKVFQDKEDCDNLPIIGLQIGKVIHTTKIKRGDKEKTASVVEIVNAEGKVLAYLPTTKPVLAKLAVIPRNKA